MIRGELAGHKVEMSGVPVLGGARQITNSEGKKGFVFDEPEEHKALLRWQVGDFDGAEVLLAEAWRLSSELIDLEGMQKTLKDTYSGRINLRTLVDTGKFVDELLRTAPPQQLLMWFLHDAGIALRENEAARVQSFRDVPPGSISSVLPYTSYCLRAALIFHFGLAFGLVSTRGTNRLDLEYFYYAPFCHVFSSGDKFHRKMASLILQQCMFVTASVLKADLADLAKQRTALEQTEHTEEGRSYGPPPNEASVTHQAWMRTMKPGFKEVAKDIANNLTPEVSAALLKKFQGLMKDKPQSELPSISMDDCEFMIMEHSVRPNGPCICGSSKLFKDCCGQKGVAAQQQGNKSQT
jgi:hypothetical protein